MDADQPLKGLFELRRHDLLGLSGDEDASIVSVSIAELPATKRTVDTVLRLRRPDGQEYLRHIEFEGRYRRGLELRLFEYSSRLAVQQRLPVATTIMFLRPPAPRELSYRELIGRRVTVERRFDVVRLWEIEPDRLLALGAGPAALVGLSRASGPRHVREAVSLITRSTRPPERNNLMYVLQALSSERYTAKQLERMIPRGVAMNAGMFAKEFRQGRAEVRAEERAAARANLLRAHRRLLIGVVKQVHPGLLAHVAPAAEACDSVSTLQRWTLAAAQRSSAKLTRLVAAAGRPTKTSVRSHRVTTPARRGGARHRP